MRSMNWMSGRIGMSRKFRVGEQVKLRGYNHRVFEVMSVKEQSEYLNRKMVTEIRYKLRDIISKEELMGFQEDVVAYTDKQRYGEKVDEYLDQYNYFMFMHKTFKDEGYKEEADNIIIELKDFVEKSG